MGQPHFESWSDVAHLTNMQNLSEADDDSMQAPPGLAQSAETIQPLDQRSAHGAGPPVPSGHVAHPTASGHPPPAPVEPKQQICFDFTKNQCSRGAACRFSHNIDLIVAVNSQEKGICFDFLKGMCCRGALCRFSHDLRNLQAAPANSQVGPGRRPGAPICYDFVKSQCTRGDECRYSHDYSAILNGPRSGTKNPQVLCIDFTRGRCTRGTSCKYSHALPHGYVALATLPTAAAAAAMDPLLLTAAAAAAQAAQGLGHAGLNTAQLAELAALSVHSSSQMMGPSAATMQQQPLQHAADTIRAAWGGSQTGMHPSSAEYAALLNELQAVSFGPAVRGAGQPTDTATAARGYGAVDPGPLPAQEANQQASMSVLSMLLLQQQQQQQQQQHGAHAVSTGVGASQPTPVQQPAAIGRAGKADGDGAVVQPPLVPFQHPLLAKVRAESKAISHSGTESPTIAASWSDAGGVGSGALSSASSPTAAALSHQSIGDGSSGFQALKSIWAEM